MVEKFWKRDPSKEYGAEIVVTPEMIKAGADYLESGELCPPLAEKMIAEEIYRIMAMRSPGKIQK